MKIIEPSVILLEHPFDPVGILRNVELCGRVCYKSEGNITSDSYKGFIERIVKRGHEAVLEHGSLIIRLDNQYLPTWYECLVADASCTGTALYLVHTRGPSGRVVSGNFRAWRDALRLCIKGSLCIPEGLYDALDAYSPMFSDLLSQVHTDKEPVTQLFEGNLKADYEIQAHMHKTLWFTCDRGVSHELVRHRPASFCQESTRYCNYSKGDFGGEITVIKPCFLQKGTSQYETWFGACKHAETAYFDMLTADCTPQQARSVLPNSLKTEVAMTATVGEWIHFLRLRCSEAAHPQMREVATLAKDALLRDLPVMEKWL